MIILRIRVLLKDEKCHEDRQHTTGMLTYSVIVYKLFGFITEFLPATRYLVKIVYTIISCRTKIHKRNFY